MCEYLIIHLRSSSSITIFANVSALFIFINAKFLNKEDQTIPFIVDDDDVPTTKQNKKKTIFKYDKSH